MRTEYGKPEPKPDFGFSLNPNVIIFGVVLFGLFACFALAGPLGLFDWLSSAFQDLNTENVTASGEDLPVLLGLYTSDSLQVTAYEIENFDEWMVSKGLKLRVSIAGTYMDFEFHNPDFNVHKELDAAWESGYTPFINLTAYQRNARQVASDPDFEERIRSWARAFARWSNGGKKRAFIAPLQEMNGGWVRYGLDPDNFKIAWFKIQRIFREEGVLDGAVSWVFAPNAWSQEGHEFERYYPGHSAVDVVAFSTMNFGACVDWGPQWDTYETIIEPYLERMREMAPGKPIFIAQTGTVAVGPDGRDDRLKNEWLKNTFRKLAAYPAVRGILYVNVLKTEVGVENCKPVDWRIYDKHTGLEYKGFLDAVESPLFAYWSPDSDEMLQIAFARRKGQHYVDVWPAAPFSGLENEWHYAWIEALADAGIAIGCRMERYNVMGEEVQMEYFCPQSPLTRAEMAVFLVLAIHGEGYWPPPAVGRFEDVPIGYWAADWIEQLANDGITAGCSENRFCPEERVSRAHMTMLLGKARHWPQEIEPPSPTGTLFEDVGVDHYAAAWIEALANDGIALGCKIAEFCPETPVTRAELAVFFAKAFNLPSQEGTSWLKEN